jgi:hypothetical protein
MIGLSALYFQLFDFLRELRELRALRGEYLLTL